MLFQFKKLKHSSALNQYKEKLCCGIIKLVTQYDGDNKLNYVEAYVLALKYSLTLKEEEHLLKLTPLLDSFIDSSVSKNHFQAFISSNLFPN